MYEIKPINLSDGSVIFVEMDKVDTQPQTVSQKYNDLPEGAELTGATETVVDTMKALKNTVSSLLTHIHEGIKDNAPDEWGVELNIGFKGKTNPIPVIVSAESNVAIKIHAKWVKPKNPQG